ncbi:glutathione S-transferase family protein [Shimia sagamensis]|uniref:Glutathione S-transferase n=1 Tax=Shimia sagamensis TaxID=1566352 RepID=A0ABY1N9P4_9RHOB|nr:glutathione S-transferase family protein [Shimia sagamensis]SMP04235.1 glutathione S-transferase [Shimia sagamensis]
MSGTSFAAPVTLCGFEDSIYTKVAMMALAAKPVAFEMQHEDPFEKVGAESHPFGRVPVLKHGDFTVYETGAITRYIERAFEGVCLVPDDAECVARMDQVIAIADNYAYWPMVRQAYAHAVVRKQAGIDWDKALVDVGLAAAEMVLAELDTIAREGHVLNGLRITLADCQLAPMLAAFAQVPKGQELIARHWALNRWLTWISHSRVFRQAVGELR